MSIQAIHLVVAGFPSSGPPSFESASVDPEAKQHLAHYIRRLSRGVLAQYKYVVANQEIRAAKARLGLGSRNRWRGVDVIRAV